ncbi:peptidase G2 autoproteolytic cleavage domain-containing protein [Pseudophaeobacter sp. C1-32P7]|uniref:peptidase G2 autoproteolytic cleavage domain-containing protein n=1 Tax=Pseudophaeobacter sp. C1-32P7 TaxID=3098142 RepID=UPI0034D39FA7
MGVAQGGHGFHCLTRPYVPRAERAEWAMVGLIGKLRLRRGQPTDARWIRLRQVSDSIEEWLLR